jgi:hypothetical protein
VYQIGDVQARSWIETGGPFGTGTPRRTASIVLRRGADAVGVLGRCGVDRVADRRQLAALRILARHHQEARRLAGGGLQVAAHRHAARVARHAAGAELADLLDLALRLARHAVEPVCGVVLEGELAGVVVFLVAARGVVRVGVADEPVLERIAVAGRFLRETVEQRLAREAAAAVLGALGIGRQRVVPLLEAGELVVGRQRGMRLRGALDLRDLVQRLVRGARNSSSAQTERASAGSVSMLSGLLIWLNTPVNSACSATM